MDHGDATYDPLTASSVVVTVIDDESAGLTISETTRSVSENGGIATYTLRLRSQPESTVTVTPVSSDTNVATVSSPLRFTTVTWSRPQSVTVTGVNNDGIDATNRWATITHTFSGDESYVDLTVGSVAVTVIDDDSAGITIDREMLSVSENRGRSTYTVRLNSRPVDTVIVTPVSSDANAAKVSPRNQGFTTGNWNTPKRFTITGINNNNVDVGNRRVTIRHEITGDSTYEALTDVDSLAVTVIDDDRAGVTISETVLSMSENAGRDTYTVRLNTRPGSTVTITPVSSDSTVARVSRALRFTTGNWNRTQRVTVTGVNNDTIDAGNRRARISHTVSGDATYAALTVGNLAVTVIDEDSAGVTISETVLSVSENGETATYTVRLNTRPGSTVTITPVSGTPGAAAVSGALRFSTGNWHRTQQVTVTGVNNNDVDAGNRRATITHTVSGDATYAALTVGNLEVTVTDDDSAGVTISETTRRVSENGGRSSYTLRLNSRPGSEVTITPVSDTPGAATVSGALRFSTGNWNRPQRVTVTGVNNNIDDVANRSATITHRVTSTAADYNGLTGVGSVAVTVTETAGVTVSETTRSVSENGGMSTYTVRLNTRPAAAVTITPRSSDLTVVRVSGARTFTPGTWNLPQRFTVTGVNNNIDDTANRSARITHSVAGAGTGYTGLTVGTVAITVTESAGVTISETARRVSKNGGTATYTLRLNTSPGTTVTVTPMSSDPTAAKVSEPLTFNDGNWETPQQVTITGVDNNSGSTANRSATITHSVSSTAADYNGLTGVGSVAVTVTEPPGLTFSRTALEVNESGTTAPYGIRLSNRPEATVTVTPVSSDTGAARVSDPLRFTTGNWNLWQWVTVTGVNNNIDDTANRSTRITHRVTSTAADYNGLSGVGTVAVTVTETAGVTISETTRSVSENGGTATYTVRLNTRPGGHSVIITPRSSNERVVTVDTDSTTPDLQNTLTFNARNWATPQPVTVIGVNNDSDDAVNRSATISHSLFSNGTDYNGLAGVASVVVTVIDDDTHGRTDTDGDDTDDDDDPDDDNDGIARCGR